MKMTAWSVSGIGEIVPGDQLGDIIVDACRAEPNGPLLNGDVLVVTQKIVSKAEGRLVAIDPDDPVSHKKRGNEPRIAKNCRSTRLDEYSSMS